MQSGGSQYPRHYTRNSTTFLIGGQGQIGDSLMGDWPLPANRLSFNPHVADTFSTERTDYVIGDAATAYPATLGVEQFDRHFLYIRPSTFVIVDRLQTAAPQTYTFMLQHRADVFSWNESRVLLTDGPASMTMNVLQPEQWTPSEEFPLLLSNRVGAVGA